jgi:hypothetical protein
VAISSCTHVWMDIVQEGYSQDVKAQQIITELSIAHFTFVDGILRYKKRIWIRDNKTLQQLILEVIHSSALGGHSGFPMTYRKMKHCLPGKV